MSKCPVRLIVVGGQAHRNPSGCPCAVVECIGSSKHGGNGAIRRALARIFSGCVDGVVIRTSHIGHSEYKSIRRACKRQGLPVRLVTGGRVGTLRALKELAKRK